MTSSDVNHDKSVTDLVDYLFIRAQRQVNEYFYEDAVDTCKELLRRTGSETGAEARAHGFLGDLYLLMRDVPAAERHLRKAVDNSPDKGEYHYLMGCALTMGSRWPEAIDFFRTANSLMPRSSGVLRGLGWAIHCTGEYAEAEEFLRESVNLDPESIATLNDLAVCLMTQNRYEDAREVVDTALDIAPDDERLTETREMISRLMVEFNRGLDEKERDLRMIGSRGYPKPVYAMVEELFDKALRRAGVGDDVRGNAKRLWLAHVIESSPNVRSPKVWAAAIEMTAHASAGESVTFRSVAERYGVGGSSISRAYAALEETKSSSPQLSLGEDNIED